MLYNSDWDIKRKVKEEPWRRILRDAKTLIQEHGWIQGEFVSEYGYCMAGAIWTAGAGEKAGISQATGRMCQTLWHQPIVRWNDTPGRTEGEVLAAFDEAIQWRGKPR